MTRSRVLLVVLAVSSSLLLATFWVMVSLLGDLDGGGPDTGPLVLALGALLLAPLALRLLAPRRVAVVVSLVLLWVVVPPALVVAVQAG